MASNQPDKIYSFEMGGIVREIAFMESVHIEEGVDSDIYSFLDAPTEVLSIVKVKRAYKSPLEKITSGDKMTEGFIKGKGTLTVYLENGTKNTYYFENAGYNKPVDIKIGQSVQWTAPHDEDLIYYKIRSIPQQVKAVPIAQPKGKPVKLFLTSSMLSDLHLQEFIKLVNKPAKSIHIALIENAADVEANSREWVARHRQSLQSHGFMVDVVDLKSYTNKEVELLEKLQVFNVFWLGCGNVFYLHWLLLSTRGNEIIKYLVNKGAVYAAGNAGSILAGPTLAHFDTAHDPNVVPEIGTDSLHFTESVVIPSFDNPNLEKELKLINAKLTEEGYETVPLKESQALIIDGDTQRII